MQRGTLRLPLAMKGRAGIIIQILALVFLLAAAWQARSSLPGIPLSTADTWGYLKPALSWLGGSGFQQTFGREWLYPGLLALFLKTGGYSGIFLWQQMLGLLAVVLMAATWRLWVSLLPLSPGVRLGVALVGILPIWVQSTNPQTLLFEALIRPEGVLQFFAYAQLACLLAYCRYRWARPDGRLALLAGGGSVFFAFACLLLKPSWMLAFCVAVSPVLIGLRGSGVSLWSRVMAPVLGAVLCVLFLWLPGWMWFIRDEISRTFLPSTLFTVHARLIERDMADEIGSLPAGLSERETLQAILTSLQRELHVAETMEHNYEKLGFDPDYLYYQSPLLGVIRVSVGDDAEKFRAFCLRRYLGAVLHNPLGFGEKVRTQMMYFLFPEPATFYRPGVNMKKTVQSARQSLSPEWADGYGVEIRESYRSYLASLEELSGHPPTLERKNMGRKVGEFFSRWAIPIEVFFFAAFAVVMMCPSLDVMKLGGWGALLLFSAPAANALTVAMVHALDINRYRYSYGGLLLFALTAMGVFGLMVIGSSLSICRSKKGQRIRD